MIRPTSTFGYMSTGHILEALKDGFGIRVEHITPLEGYISKNYRVKSQDKTYILKIYPNDQEIIEDIHGESHVLEHLNNLPFLTPRPVRTQRRAVMHIDLPNEKVYRLLSFVDGQIWANHKPNHEAINLLGQSLGLLDEQLSKVNSAAIKARAIPWDIAHLLENEQYCALINDPQDRSIVEYFLLQWKTHVISKLHHLRKGMIHNDANENNITHINGRFHGMYDFGDMVHTYLINEVAVAGTYLAMASEQPIKVVSSLILGYHSKYPILQEELDLLYYFIAGRLCTSILQAAFSASDQPDNEYAQSSNTNAWKLLKNWITINPLHATNTWRKVLGYDEVPQDQHLRKRREKYMPGSYSMSYAEPIHMIKAAFQYMYDAEGNAILDAYNNIIQVGHSHPRVVSAGQEAMASLNTNTRYLYDHHAQYAEHLLSHFPKHINKLYLVNSGSAASDLAIRLSQSFTEKSEIAVLKHGYHGNTMSTIDISHYKYGNRGGTGRKANIVELDLPDTYRGIYQDEDQHDLYARDACLQLDAVRGLAAFVAEPIVGCGGQIPLPTDYLTTVYEKVRELGGVCISDEVQTGFGRTGKCFWGYELYGAIPDIIIMGKPIGNGHPMAAVATTSEIADAFDNGMEFFSSFGGNPVSCAIGNAVLDVLEEEGLQAKAVDTGQFLQQQFWDLSKEFPVIGDVRGSGLFIGVEIISQDGDKVPGSDLAKEMINKLRKRNILTSLDGPDKNVIKIKPPLRFNKQNAAHLINEVYNILK